MTFSILAPNMNTVYIMHDVETLYWIPSGLDCRTQISV